MLKACGHYLIVKLEPIIEEKTYGDVGIVIQETLSEKKRQQSGGQFANVLDIGVNCWSVHTDADGVSRPWCEVGDRVMIARYSGQTFPIDDGMDDDELKENELLRLIKDDDILAVEVDDE
jgi:co-chaperonin GroES (HSP10)